MSQFRSHSASVLSFSTARVGTSRELRISPVFVVLEAGTSKRVAWTTADRHGNRIAPIWFEQGVVPVQNELRDLARHKLRDVHRVSELAEITVHKLWEMHGEDAGACPWRRVWSARLYVI